MLATIRHSDFEIQVVSEESLRTSYLDGYNPVLEDIVYLYSYTRYKLCTRAETLSRLTFGRVQPKQIFLCLVLHLTASASDTDSSPLLLCMQPVLLYSLLCSYMLLIMRYILLLF